MNTSRLRLLWGLVAVVVVALLVVGVTGQGGRSPDERARALESQVRCPQCRSQSVSQSDTPSAKGVKVVIRDQIAAGRSDEEILDFIASRYGREVLLEPPASGVGGLVWAIPVVGVVVAVAALVVRFRGYRARERVVPSALDRDLVAGALAARHRGGEVHDDADGETRGH